MTLTVGNARNNFNYLTTGLNGKKAHSLAAENAFRKQLIFKQAKTTSPIKKTQY